MLPIKLLFTVLVAGLVLAALVIWMGTMAVKPAVTVIAASHALITKY